LPTGFAKHFRWGRFSRLRQFRKAVAGQIPALRDSTQAMHRFCGQLGGQADHDWLKFLIRQGQARSAQFLGKTPDSKKNQALGAFQAVDKLWGRLSAQAAG
jgi:hypothetical protein